MLSSVPMPSSSMMFGKGLMIRRWSLSKLADLEPTASTAQMMLEEVATRLELQAMACESLLDETMAMTTTSSLTTLSTTKTAATVTDLSDNNNDHHANLLIQRQLSFLRHVHVDTAQQCRQVLERREHLSQRWSNTDQRMVRKCLEQVRDRHAPSLERWVEMAIALRNSNLVVDHNNNNNNNNKDRLLDNLLRGRLSIQLLAHHYSLLAQEDEHQRRPTGAISINHSLADLVHDAYTEAHFLCEAHYQKAPDLQLGIPDDLLITVIRPWLTHILVEICKNGMSATVQRHCEPYQHHLDDPQCDLVNDNIIDNDHNDDDDDLPPPLIVSAQHYYDDDDKENDGQLVLTVRDHGVGLPTTNHMDLFGWGTSSASKRWDRIKEQQTYAAVRPPLASLGVGLPSSRAMLRQFGGDLELISHNHHHHNDDDDNNNHQPRSENVHPVQGGCTARIILPQNTNIEEDLPSHFAEWENPDF